MAVRQSEHLWRLKSNMCVVDTLDVIALFCHAVRCVKVMLPVHVNIFTYICLLM